MLTLQKIQLINFLSHPKTTIEFKEEQHLEISGKSGSGKSSINEAILWCLYGRGRTDNNRSLIKRGAKKTVVTVVLIDNEEKKEYCIERSTTDKGKNEITVSENNIPIKVTGIKETQDYIEKKILHASYLLFVNSILYKQDNQETFVNQNAGKKKDILLEIVRASDYDEYLEKTKKELQKIRINQEVVLSKIEGKQNVIKNNQSTAERLGEYEKEEEHLKQEIENLKKQFTELTSKEKQVAENLIMINSQQEKIETKLKDYNAKTNRLAELNQKIIELSSIDIEIIKKEIIDLNEVKTKVKECDDAKEKLILWSNQRATIMNEAPPQHDYQTDIDYINKELINKINDNVGQCPKCGYIDPGREQKKKDVINDLEGRLKTTQNEFEAYTKILVTYSIKLKDLGTQPELPLLPEQYTELKEQLNKLDELNKKLINAENAEKEKRDAVAEIELIKAEQLDLDKEIKTIEAEVIKKDTWYQEERKIKDDIIKINGKIDELMMAHNSNNQLLGGAKYAVKQIEQSKIDLETLQKNLEKDKESLEALELLKDAFGPNGIKTILIDYIIPQLEDSINNILSKLSNFKVRLDTQKGGIGEDIMLEGLYITVVNEEGEEMDYMQYSGGEKVKISMSIGEALAEISHIGFRFLDETIVALDNDSVQNFMVAMEGILMKVKQVICISHISEIKNMFDEKITVIKVNGDSRI